MATSCTYLVRLPFEIMENDEASVAGSILLAILELGVDYELVA